MILIESVGYGCSEIRSREARGAASSWAPWDYPRLHRQQALALYLFTGEPARALDGVRSLLGGFS
jgi:hypothetical protein